MQDVNPEKAGLIWDFFNMWIITKQAPTDMYQHLKKYIHHVHVKDGLLVNGKEKYCLLGKGEAPINEVMQLLQQNKYKGFFSFEWEKMWHKEIEEPEIALAHYSKEIRKYFT
jgi:sugar phosphate isomerase/epimerase